MERRIKLTDEQFKVLEMTNRELSKVTSVISDLIMKCSEEVARKERDMWDSVRQLAGCGEHELGLTIDWLNREIVVERDE